MDPKQLLRSRPAQVLALGAAAMGAEAAEPSGGQNQDSADRCELASQGAAPANAIARPAEGNRSKTIVRAIAVVRSGPIETA